jgi:hypothetical protein
MTPWLGVVSDEIENPNHLRSSFYQTEHLRLQSKSKYNQNQIYLGQARFLVPNRSVSHGLPCGHSGPEEQNRHMARSARRGDVFLNKSLTCPFYGVCHGMVWHGMAWHG